MANLGIEIDTDKIECGQFGTIPDGWYTANIVSSEVGINKKGTGKLLKLRFDILEGEYAGRVIWMNINYQHDSEVAQRIGLQQFKAICDAVGHTGPIEDTELLHDIPMMVKVVVTPAEGAFEEKNDIKDWKPTGATDAPPKPKIVKPAGNGAQQTVTAPAARPWGNRK